MSDEIKIAIIIAVNIVLVVSMITNCITTSHENDYWEQLNKNLHDEKRIILKGENKIGKRK